MEDQIPHLASLTAGLGWVLLITAERMGVPAPHMVSTDPVGGGTFPAVGMKVLSWPSLTPPQHGVLHYQPYEDGSLGFPCGHYWHEWQLATVSSVVFWL